MSGSVFGKQFTVSTWGESHGPALGAVIDGCPAGLSLSEADLTPYLERRRPGQSRFTTKRNEPDAVKILSGVLEGKTTGTPISLVLFNEDQRSGDYANLAEAYRPGHADFTFDRKYGFRDAAGGGRSSGRETVCRVAAGAVAAKLLREFGITVNAYTRSIGPVSISSLREEAIRENPLCMPDPEAAEKAEEYLEGLMKEGNSAGGVIECVIRGCPAGLGDPVFDKLSARLASGICSIGAVKGFEIGDGFSAAASTGADNNDPFAVRDGKIVKLSNHSGGVLGGISDGSEIVFRAAVKPTPSISSPQQTVTKDGKETELTIKGRHDPVIVPRAVVVVECMACLVLADALICNMSSRLDRMIDFYQNRN